MSSKSPNEWYYSDYPTKKIGGGNPYQKCAFCGRSEPEINGKLDNHLNTCTYRKWMKEHPGQKFEVGGPYVYVLKLEQPDDKDEDAPLYHDVSGHWTGMMRWQILGDDTRKWDSKKDALDEWNNSIKAGVVQGDVVEIERYNQDGVWVDSEVITEPAKSDGK